ncbi:penicillin-binding protein activator LpoB [Bordetella genomosp. 1]|uniref:Penicillin-binding protein activator LpoB n=2 Tax=Bordetella genomosp. 1 TaxID=1395607 RepID=A0A261SHC7_9BORD|nr:penicillin-binding protein activator LpoB [Bordetella genomosp. 1]
MKMTNSKRLICGLLLSLAWGLAQAAEPKIAVTDLAYEERVSGYFRVVSASSQSRVNRSSSERDSGYAYSGNSRYSGSASSSYHSAEGTYSYIEYGELRKYTADLKGAMLKGGGVRLVQAKAYTGKASDKVFDIVSRIKQGYFPGADYVLFGTVSDIQFTQNQMSFGGAARTGTLGLDITVDFSLIDTRTYEVKAAFSALGSGQDVKAVSRAGDSALFSRPKAVSEASKSLAEAAYGELMQQFGLPGRHLQGQGDGGAPPARASRNEPVVSY